MRREGFTKSFEKEKKKKKKEAMTIYNVHHKMDRIIKLLSMLQERIVFTSSEERKRKKKAKQDLKNKGPNIRSLTNPSKRYICAFAFSSSI